MPVWSEISQSHWDIPDYGDYNSWVPTQEDALYMMGIAIGLTLLRVQVQHYYAGVSVRHAISLFSFVCVCFRCFCSRSFSLSRLPSIPLATGARMTRVKPQEPRHMRACSGLSKCGNLCGVVIFQKYHTHKVPRFP